MRHRAPRARHSVLAAVVVVATLAGITSVAGAATPRQAEAVAAAQPNDPVERGERSSSDAPVDRSSPIRTAGTSNDAVTAPPADASSVDRSPSYLQSAPTAAPEEGTPGSIHVVVVNSPDSPQDFGFTWCLADACTDVALDDDGDATLADTLDLVDLASGTYTITQDAPPGWSLWTIDCTSGGSGNLDERQATVVLADGQVTTCTFRNRANAIAITHDTSKPSAQDFTYRACPDTGGECVEFLLDDDNDATNPSIGVLDEVPAGTTYTVTMETPEGWGVPRRACSQDAAEISTFRWVVTATAGQTLPCVSVVTPTSVTVKVDPGPLVSRDFPFTGCAGLAGAHGCGDFALDNDVDPVLGSSITFASLTAGEVYTLTQAEVSGWGLTRITCTNGQVDLASRRVTIELHPGEQLQCTFANDVNSLRIVQDTDPNGPTDFTYVGCAGPEGANGCSSLSLDDDATDATLASSVTYRELPAGQTYTITQQATGGFPLTGLTCSSGVVELSARRATVLMRPGVTVSCTFVNRATSLRIVQDTDINDGEDFRFRGCAGPGGANGCSEFLLDDSVSDTTLPASVTYSSLEAGTAYSVVQEDRPGYGLTGLSCTGGSGSSVDRPNRQVTVTLQPGEQVTCTFVNQATQLTIEVDTTPDNSLDIGFTGCAGPEGALGCSDFALHEPQAPTAAGRYRQLQAGVEYSVVQHQTVGIGLRSITCTNGQVRLAERRVTVVLAAGEQVKCTFASDVNRVRIVEDSVPANAQAFEYTLCGPTPEVCRAFSLADISDPSPFDGVTTFDLLPAGPYTLTQAALPNWGLVSLACTSEGVDEANRRVSFFLDPGEGIDCTFTNRPSSITITADTIADAARDLAFTLCPSGGAPCTTFDLDDDADATLSNSRAFLPLDPGVYTVTQDSVDPVMITSISCSADQTIDLGARQVALTVTTGVGLRCTFTNSVPSITVAHDTSPNSSADVTYTLCSVATSTCSNVVLDDDTSVTRPSTATFADLAPGSYTVTQTAVSGHVLTSITCNTGETVDLGAALATVTLTAGEQAACTFRST